jgi:hypothetical protein
LPVCQFTWYIERLRPTNGGSKQASVSGKTELLTVAITFTFGDHTSSKPERSNAPPVSRSASANENVQTSAGVGACEAPTITAERTKHEVSKICARMCTCVQTRTCRSRLFDTPTVNGVHLSQYIDGMPCTYSLATKRNDYHRLTRCLRFDPHANGRQLWRDLYDNGVVTLGYGTRVCACAP